MGYVYTKNLTPGMVTAADVYNFDDQLIIPANTVLDDTLISRMAYYSIQRINIKEEDPIIAKPETEIEVETKPESETEVKPEQNSYSAKIVSSPNFKNFKQNFTENVDILQQSMQEILENDEPFEEKKLLDKTSNLVNPKATTIEVFDMIHNMRQYDDSTYAHSINVSLICRIMAKWLKFSEEETNTLALCGLLHDIGKLSIPTSIINKPGKLTPEEYEIIKTHTTKGYEALKKLHLDERVANCALMHHERCDGSGYPNGLRGTETEAFAKIIAIADVYEAMTAMRIYRDSQCPFKVISIFEEEGLQKYEPLYILTFLERIASSYMNNTVLLSDDRIGEIILINPKTLAKPVIRIGEEYIDLSKETDLYITKLV